MRTLRVYDLKLGRHKVYAYDVLVPAHKDVITGEDVPEVVRANLQLASYALGALERHGLMHDYTHVSMTIIQPFVSHLSEYTCTVEELLEVRDFLAKKAIEVRTNPQFVPSQKSCHFCRAAGPSCKAQTEMVLATTLQGFEDVSTAVAKPINVNQLGSLYEAIPLIRGWCDSVEEMVRDHLHQGLPVVRNDGVAYKLVEGKNLPRKWADADEAEAAMKKMRLKQEQMYSMSIISPTQAEKLATPAKVKKGETPPPPALGKTQWSRLQGLIATGQKGAPQIALETDPRPAIAKATDGFEDVPTETEIDLFN